MFYTVTYKNVGKAKSTSIVQANTKDEAIKIFNNPEEIGLQAEIKEVRASKRIPKGWNVVYETGNGFPVTGKTNADIALNDENKIVVLTVGNRKVKTNIKDITGAFKPSRDNGVMKRGTGIGY